MFGAGAIGGHLAARLAKNGVDVSVVARGAQAAAIASVGLTVRSPSETLHCRPRIGSPAGISQVLTEIELADARHEGEFERLRLLLAGRYAALKTALDQPTRNWRVFPFNAGCFCLLELRAGLDAEAIRQELIHDESVGVVSQGDRYLRIAFCSIEETAIVPLVQALNRVCERH